MRIIVHCIDPDDLIFAMRALKSSIRHGYDSCAYAYGEPERVSVYAYKIKTGWSVRVRAKGAGE